MKLQLICLVTVLGLVGCSSVEEKEAPDQPAQLPVKTVTETPTAEATHVAIEHDADYVAELKFAKGSAALTAESKKELTELLDRARKGAGIEEIKVISWADRVYPPNNEKAKLSNKDRALAGQRNDVITGYIKAYGQTHNQPTLEVEAYNMAERPSEWQKLFGSEQAEMKKSLENMGLSADSRTGGRAGSAMVMVERKD